MSIEILQVCDTKARHKVTLSTGQSLYEGCPARVKPSRANDFRKVCTQPLKQIGKTYKCDAPGCKSKAVQKHWQDKLELPGWIEHSSTTAVWRNGSFEMVQHDAHVHFCSNKCKQKYVNDPRPIDSRFYEELKANKRMLDSLPDGEFLIEHGRTG